MSQPIGNRILILGCPGSGKSTLALALAARTGLPLVHLDNVWWRADGTHISREAFDGALQELLRGEKWILDGDYSRTYQVRIQACDTVVFLDYDEATCMDGITARVGQARPDMPWTEQILDEELVSMVKAYGQRNRPTVLALLARYPEKQVFRFTDRAQTERWLESL